MSGSQTPMPSPGTAYRAYTTMRFLVNSLERIFMNTSVQMFTLTYLAYATLYSTRKPFSVVKTHMQEELNLSTYWLSAIDTAFLGAYAAGQLFLPTLIAALGFATNRALFVCFAGSGVVTIIFGIASDARVLTFSWLLNGLLHAAVFPLFVASITPWFHPGSRGQIMGSWTTSQQLGATLATAFSAFVSQRWGFRTVFIIPGVAVMIVGAFVHSMLQSCPGVLKDVDTQVKADEGIELKSAVEGVSDTEVPDTESCTGLGRITSQSEQSLPRSARAVELSPGKWQEVKKPISPKSGANTINVSSAARIRDIKSVAGAYFCVKCIRYSLLFWLPFYLTKHLSYEPGVAGYTSMLFDIGGMLGGLGTGWISDKLFGRRRLLVTAVMCLVSALALFVFCATASDGIGVLFPALLIVGFTVAGPDSILGGATAQDLVERSGYPNCALPVAAGIVNGMGSVGAVVQGYLTAHISNAYGWNALFGTLCAIAVAASLLLVKPVFNEWVSRDGLLF